jgi:CoA:oxalate CoA-transferase
VSKGGVPCGPINNIAQAIAHPQVAARNMLVDVPDGSGGTLKLAGNPLKMSAFPIPRHAPAARTSTPTATRSSPIMGG